MSWLLTCNVSSVKTRVNIGIIMSSISTAFDNSSTNSASFRHRRTFAIEFTGRDTCRSRRKGAAKTGDMSCVQCVQILEDIYMEYVPIPGLY